MRFDEYNNENIINFYIKNGLEFDENKKYFGTNIKTFALIEDEKIIRAVSISKYNGNSFIEALSVDKKYRNKGYGELLVQKAIN